MKLPSILGTRGARDKPKDSYGGSAYSFFFGRSTSGKNVNERTAMQTTAVYSCVRILAGAIASLLIHVYRYTETGKERGYDHPLYYLLHDEPNPEITSFVFRETLMSHLLIWGNAYAQIIRDGNGRVISNTGRCLRASGCAERPGKGKGELAFRLRRPEKCREGGCAVGGHEVPADRIPPEEAQFLETRKFRIDEIARLYRIPPHMVGDLDKSSFSNIEQQSLEFVKYTLDPWVVRWEQSIQRALFLPQEKREYFVKMNVDGLLRGDYQSRMNGYAVGRHNGWLSTNDIREMENMNLIPEEEGGNLYLINGNMTKLKDAGLFAGNGGFLASQRVDGKLILSEAVKTMTVKKAAS